MSSDVQVLFLYDTLRCRREEDDPKDAILYFHPADYSVDQKVAICGQLMGVTHFCSDLFSMPKILNLQRGKFAVRQFGIKYVLALGCASFTPDGLLQTQIDLLCDLIRMFHHDIEDIFEEACGNLVTFARKLAHVCDYYLPLSEYNGDSLSLGFGALPTLFGLKDAGHIDSRARELLQACRKICGVIGGQILCQSRVICSDLPQKLAQRFALLQAHEYPPAQFVDCEAALPEGVVLFAVYLSERELKACKANIGRYIPPSNSTLPFDISQSDHAYDGEPSDTSYNTGYSEFFSSADVEDSGAPIRVTTEKFQSDTSEEIEPPALPLYCKKVLYETGRKSQSLDLRILDFDKEADVAKRTLLMACSLPETTFSQRIQADISDGNEMYATEAYDTESGSRDVTSDSSAELTTTSSSVNRELQANGLRCWKAANKSPSVTHSSQSSFGSNSKELTERFNILQLRPAVPSSSHSSSTSPEVYYRAIAYIQNCGSMRLIILIDAVEVDLNSVRLAYELGNASLLELQTLIYNEEKMSSCEARSGPSGYLRYQHGSRTLLPGGKSHSMDYNNIQSLHKDFSKVKDLTEVVIRNDGYTLYGNRRFGSEEYFQESLSSVGSVRSPSTASDLIERPISRTSRNIQRDVQIVMF